MNKYEVLSTAGEGAFGVVLKCRSKESGQLVAIKKIKNKKETDDGVCREAQLLRELKQENIVQLLEIFRRKSTLYLVFEYVDQNMLQIIQSSETGLTGDQVRNYSYQLLKAVSVCHSRNIIHRDIKPENVLVATSHNILKLCDFGYAARSAAGSCSAVYTDFIATRWYRSPELLLGAACGKEADVWSVGCIIGEMSDGKPLFPGQSEIDQLHVIQSVLGPLTEKQQHMFYRCPRFNQLRFPSVSRYKGLEKRYRNIIDAKLLECLKDILQLEGSLRLTADEALNHKVFIPEVARDPNQLSHINNNNRNIPQPKSRADAVNGTREQNGVSEGAYRDAHSSKLSSNLLLNNGLAFHYSPLKTSNTKHSSFIEETINNFWNKGSSSGGVYQHNSRSTTDVSNRVDRPQFLLGSNVDLNEKSNSVSNLKRLGSQGSGDAAAAQHNGGGCESPMPTTAKSSVALARISELLESQSASPDEIPFADEPELTPSHKTHNPLLKPPSFLPLKKHSAPESAVTTSPTKTEERVLNGFPKFPDLETGVFSAPTTPADFLEDELDTLSSEIAGTKFFPSPLTEIAPIFNKDSLFDSDPDIEDFPLDGKADASVAEMVITEESDDPPRMVLRSVEESLVNGAYKPPSESQRPQANPYGDAKISSPILERIASSKVKKKSEPVAITCSKEAELATASHDRRTARDKVSFSLYSESRLSRVQQLPPPIFLRGEPPDEDITPPLARLDLSDDEGLEDEGDKRRTKSAGAMKNSPSFPSDDNQESSSHAAEQRPKSVAATERSSLERSCSYESIHNKSLKARGANFLKNLSMKRIRRKTANPDKNQLQSPLASPMVGPSRLHSKLVSHAQKAPTPVTAPPSSAVSTPSNPHPAILPGIETAI